MDKNFNQLAILSDCIFHFINMDFEDVQKYEGNLILTIKTHLKAFVWLWNFYGYLLLAPKCI